MSQINTNVQAMIAQRVMGQQNNALNQAMERLSTGLRINRGADDPAGLIASENLRSERESLSAAIGNAQRADQIMNVAEGGMQEVNNALLELESLIVQSANDAGMSQEEREANQQQVDSILQSIDRIASTTQFQGESLLNGSYEFDIEGQHEDVSNIIVDAAKMGDASEVALDVDIETVAAAAELVIDADPATLGAAEEITFRITGPDGSADFTFNDGDDVAAVEAAIAAQADALGVTVEEDGGEITITSAEIGANQSISIEVLAGSEDIDAGEAGSLATLSATDTAEVSGTDLVGTINGIDAKAEGETLTVNTADLSASIDLNVDDINNGASFTAGTITGGGAAFNLGPQVNLDNEERLAIHSVSSERLGNLDVGFLNELGLSGDANLVDGDLTKAQNIVSAAINEVSSQRGRIGAFQANTVQSSMNAMQITLENVSAAESTIRDADFAQETAELTRAQILSQAAMNSLSLASNQPQSVLQLLG